MALRRAVLLLLALALGATASAQSPPPPPQLVVLVRDPSGQAVADATGTLLCSPANELPALAGAPPPRAPVVVSGRSDAQGLLRFRAPEPARVAAEADTEAPAAPIEFATDGPAQAGGGLVTTDQGLGALLPRLRPGRAQRVLVQPMAEVTTSTGSETFVLHLRAHTADHGTVSLPAMRGTRALLPAGSYEVWAASDDGWTWQRLELVSAQRALLHFDGPAQRLQVRRGITVHPTGWPELSLGAPGAEIVLRGAALAAPLTAVDLDDGVLVADRPVPMPPRDDAIAWPPSMATAGERRAFTIDPAVADASLFSLRHTASGGWLLLGGDRADANGDVSLPEPGDGDIWLLLVAEGQAPVGRPWSTTPTGSKLTFPRGLPLQVQARAPDGDPAIDLVVEYVPADAEVAAVRARSDSRGLARLGVVTAPGTLFVRDPRYGNQALPVPQIPLEALPVQLDAGSSLRGRALLDDGSPAAGAVVTLRDPSGRLQPSERAVVAAADGAFEFFGLPDDRGLVLFASMARDGHTWSGRLSHLAADQGTTELVLRDEDPKLLPR